MGAGRFGGREPPARLQRGAGRSDTASGRTPMTARLALAVALATSLALPVAGCVVIDAPRGYRYSEGGPPPHAPAHGHRRKHQRNDLVFDSELGVYAVVGLTDVWYLDGSYFRIRGDRWEIGVDTHGPWRVAQANAVPGRLYAKRHPHGAPPGQAKKEGRKR